MAKDVDLLVKNAKTYNEPGSQVFKASKVCDCKFMRTMSVVIDVNVCSSRWQDANNIKRIFAQKKSEIEHGEPIKSSVRIR